MTFLSHRKILCDKKALRAGSRCGGEENVDKSTRRRRRISQSEILSCDEDGSILGFKYNGNIYFYRKNLQGDITGIRNSAGTLITEYRYDAWGDIISVTGTQGNTIGAINPFRYRGYISAGGEFNIIPDTENNTYYYGQTKSFGFGTPGGELHVEWAQTATYLPSEFNIYDVLNDFFINIMEW